MAEKTTKTSNSKAKYKAVNPGAFANMYNDTAPKYNELCKGESVDLDRNSRIVKDWLRNNIITKEK
tara:strand:- start:64 stop:261 length:198 start_codon:yes stop_codon:yes gene_type:complete